MTDFTTFLMWANQDPQHPNSFVIKLANQKLLGLVRTDKQGQTYWKFKVRRKKSVNHPSSCPVMDNLPKFQQKQTKTPEINHDQANSEQSANQPSH